MALQAFKDNPGLAGFTTESDTSGTFCQIIKELVDNAVDALEGAVGNVHIKVEPSSRASTILRITVTDDGTGMEDPFSFANAFNSSKGQETVNERMMKRAREGEDEDEGDDAMKYMRKSKSGKSWVCTLCKKKCLKEETMRKHARECGGVGFEDHGDIDDDELGLYVKERGTTDRGHQLRSVSSSQVSVPSSQVIPQVSTQTAGRFGVGLTLCILHSFIGTGGRTVIRSTRRGSDIERVCALVADVRGDKIVEVGEGREVPADVEAGGTSVSMLLPKGNHEEAFPRIAEYLSRFHLLSGGTAANFSLSLVAPTLSPMELTVKPKESLVDGVRAFLNKPELDESHVASRSIIVGFNGSEISVQVTLVFEGVEEEDGWEEGEEEGGGGWRELGSDDDISRSDSEGEGEEGEDNHPASTSNRRSDLSLVRIYNNSAMLDSVEGRACGIVAAIPKCPAWKKYGLKVEGSTGGVEGLDLPTFTVKDSELAWEGGGRGGGTHQLLEERGPMPVGIRLGNILLIVHITASNKDLTLPTLSKGRIGEDVRIRKGVSVCLEGCLESLAGKNEMLIFDRPTLLRHNRARRDVEIVCEGICNILERGGERVDEDDDDDEEEEEEEEEENGGGKGYKWGKEGRERMKKKMREAIERFDRGMRVKELDDMGRVKE